MSIRLREGYGATGEQDGGEKPPESTGLEPATSAVTGRRSNQLS